MARLHGTHPLIRKEAREGVDHKVLAAKHGVPELQASVIWLQLLVPHSDIISPASKTGRQGLSKNYHCNDHNYSHSYYCCCCYRYCYYCKNNILLTHTPVGRGLGPVNTAKASKGRASDCMRAKIVDSLPAQGLCKALGSAHTVSCMPF